MLKDAASMRWSAIFALVLISCGGEYEPTGPSENGSGGGGPGGGMVGGVGTADDAMVRSLFDTEAQPAMLRSTCNSCHALGVPTFGTTYDSLVAYGAGKLLDCATPSASLLVTKGAHPPGVAFMAGDQAIVEAWLMDWRAMSSRCNP